MLKTLIIIFITILLGGCSVDKNYKSIGDFNVENNANSEKNKILSTNEIFLKAAPAVVYISTDKSSGSGVIFDNQGYILTNEHVVRNNEKVKIKLYDKRNYDGQVLGTNQELDLAIVKINDKNIPFAELGDSDNLKPGDEVFSLGYPVGFDDSVSIKEGIFSRNINDGGKNFIEASAEIQNGSSGGPLIDKNGFVVAITAGMISGYGDSLKLSIPINVVKEKINELKNNITVIQEPVSGNINIDSRGTVENRVPQSCQASMDDLQIIDMAEQVGSIGRGYWECFLAECNIRVYGIIKNNSKSCSATEIKLEVNLIEKDNIIQKQPITLLNKKGYGKPSFLTIAKDNTGEFSAAFNAYESLLDKSYIPPIGLKPNIKFRIKIISAKWE